MTFLLYESLLPLIIGWDFVEVPEKKKLYTQIEINQQMETISSSFINYICESIWDT